MDYKFVKILKLSKLKTIFYNILLYSKLKENFGKLYLFKGSKLIIHKNADFKIGGKVNLAFPLTSKFYEGCKYETLLNLKRGSSAFLGENLIIGPECRIVVEEHGDFSVGKNTYLSAEDKIMCYKSIKIGDNCSISWNVLIMDSDGKSLCNKNPIGTIEIGDKVWIGANAVILKDTIIEEGCVVAANSVVKGKFKKNSLIAGNPARVVKENISWN